MCHLSALSLTWPWGPGALVLPQLPLCVQPWVGAEQLLLHTAPQRLLLDAQAGCLSPPNIWKQPVTHNNQKSRGTPASEADVLQWDREHKGSSPFVPSTGLVVHTASWQTVPADCYLEAASSVHMPTRLLPPS